jgi:hypothetical protein
MTMKKNYQKPTMEVVNMKYEGILAFSGGFNAPQMNGYDWVEKDYQFGGLDLEKD